MQSSKYEVKASTVSKENFVKKSKSKSPKMSQTISTTVIKSLEKTKKDTV